MKVTMKGSNSNPNPNPSGGGFNQVDINAINNLALKAGVKPLTTAQLNKMTPQQIKTWISTQKATLAMNRKNFRRSSRQYRKNAKPVITANERQAQMMHTTIRQGLAELGGLGAQGVAQLGLSAFSKPAASSNAVDQNTGGGVYDFTSGTDTEKGPVASKPRRDED